MLKMIRLKAQPLTVRGAFPLLCVTVFALGCVLRLQPWREPLLPAAASETTSGAGASPAPTFEALAPDELPAGLGDVIWAFYDRVDRGKYGEAYDLSLENKWALQADGSYAHAGLTPRQEFIDTLIADWGANGDNITVPAVQILAVRPTSPAGKAPAVASPPEAEQPELAILNHLPAGLRLATLYEVDVTGMVGDVCTPARFDKRLLVADFGGGQWRVLLPGGPRPESKRKAEWFTNANPFAGKQLTDERKQP